MAYKLAIGNVFEFRVRADIKTVGNDHSLDCRFTADRLSAEEAADLINGKGEAAESTIKDFLLQHIKDWRGQKLVLDDNDQPAHYSPESMGAMLSVAGLGMVIYMAYIKALAAADTSEGRRKN